MRTDPVRRLLLAPLAGAALAACSSAPPAVPQVRVDAPPPPPVARTVGERAVFRVAAAVRPDKLVVDGDLAEWGDLGPKEKAPSKGGAPTSEKTAAALPPSSVTFAITSEGVALAAELAPEAGEAFWLALVLDVPEVPPIGYLTRSGGVMPMFCDEESMDEGVRERCKIVTDAHESFVDEYTARFRAHYRVDRNGVSVYKDGALTPVPGAKAVFKPAKQGFTVEATFPSKALPRTTQAPLVELAAYARGASGQKPPSLPAEQWTAMELPAPVGFEPHAALREAAFSKAQGRLTYKPFSMSYQPGEDLDLEDVNYQGADSMFVMSSMQILFSKQAVLGDVEIGYTYTGTPTLGLPWVAVVAMKNGVPSEVVELYGEVKGVKERDGEVYIFAYSYWGSSDGTPTAEGTWSAVAVTAEGTLRHDILEPVPMPTVLVSPVESHAADFSTLTLAGTLWDPAANAPGDPIVATWKYDAKTKSYVATVEVESKPAPRGGAKAGATKKGTAKR